MEKNKEQAKKIMYVVKRLKGKLTDWEMHILPAAVRNLTLKELDGMGNQVLRNVIAFEERAQQSKIGFKLSVLDFAKKEEKI